MSHQDIVYKIPIGFKKKIASTSSSPLTIIENKKKDFGVQFHPEVTHTINGKKLIKNFIFSICKIKKNWKMGIEKKQ